MRDSSFRDRVGRYTNQSPRITSNPAIGDPPTSSTPDDARLAVSRAPVLWEEASGKRKHVAARLREKRHEVADRFVLRPRRAVKPSRLRDHRHANRHRFARCAEPTYTPANRRSMVPSQAARRPHRLDRSGTVHATVDRSKSPEQSSQGLFGRRQSQVREQSANPRQVRRGKGGHGFRREAAGNQSAWICVN